MAIQHPNELTKVTREIGAIVGFLQETGTAFPEINKVDPSLEDVTAALYYLNEYFPDDSDTPDSED